MKKMTWRASLLFVCMLTASTNLYSQGLINLNMKRATLAEVILALKKQTETGFFYDTNNPSIGQIRNLNISVKNADLKDVLNTILKDTDLTWSIVNDVVIIKTKKIGEPASVQQHTVTGTVKDNLGLPLPGVTVRVKGTTEQVSTDKDGRFSLSVSGKAAILQFSFVGMKSQEIALTGKRELNVFMEEAKSTMDEVVVTGIYTRKKESFSGSTATFKGTELKSVGASNLIQSLKTLDPSFKIIDNNQFGSNPNRMPDIEIRGKSSVMGFKEEFGTDPNQPLFILDGFESSLSVVMDLNMNRVESVTLLKDAASTAIYGSKAANGVVVIETKRPEKGQLRLSYKGDFSTTLADLSDYNLMNSTEKLRFEELAGFYNDKTNDPLNQLRLTNLKNDRSKEIGRGVDTYWLSEPIRTGFSARHNVYAEGGEEKIRYGLGLSYGNVQGVMKGSDRKTISGNLDLIYRTNKFQFSNKLTIDHVKSNDPAVAFSEYAMANPYYRKYNAEGGIDKYLYFPDPITEESPVANPLWNAHLNNTDRTEQFGFSNNFILEWFATADLRARAKFGISKSNETQEERLSPLHSNFDAMAETEKGLYSNLLRKSLSYEGDLALTYGKLLNGVHMINVVTGLNFNTYNNINNGYSATGFTEDQFDAPSFTNGYPIGGKPAYSERKTRAASFYLNGGYAYDNRYLLDFNYRSDGASMFGTDNRFRNTWSVGLGWNVHNEQFMKHTDLFQLLKIRGSVGNPGNQNFAAYQAFSTYGFNRLSNVFGTGVLLSSLGNKGLAWQETINYNMGTDITMFNNRLNVTVDLYRKVTDPLIAIITTPGSLGVNTMVMNTGQQKTKGIEGSVKYSPIYRPKERINWNLSLNVRTSQAEYAKIGNSLSALNQAGRASLSGTTRYYDGGSPTAIWAVRSAGIDPATGKELFIKRDGSYTFNYDVNDEVVTGNTEPKLEGIFGTTLYYKGFSVGAYIRYRFGGQMFNEALYNKVENINLTDIAYNQDKRALYDRWSTPGQIAQFKGISMIQRTDRSSRFTMDENTISGESFNAGYEFTQPFVKRLGISALSVQATMNDLFRYSTIKNERGIDYPFARTVALSLSATF